MAAAAGLAAAPAAAAAAGQVVWGVYMIAATPVAAAPTAEAASTGEGNRDRLRCYVPGLLLILPFQQQQQQ